ncbi:hypothetical protein [Gynuella sunshinyii]|uniref:Uncharacterized protein n=1 Tax=Gynuella sunshinyii YC6258 TaxID=1445510 RepID=A0A0C5VNU3_9GAMM|nr:hypothetical protein [Gynuella sunshinyii]AJQ95981.1 hypothetical Protein YC6258_03945 [Gynuella sunshinyii YC6258]
MFRMTLAILLTCSFILSGCNAMAQNNKTETSSLNVFNPRWEGDHFIIEVMSNGCTDSSDLEYSITDEQLTFSRIRSDNCRAMPHLVALSFQLDQAFTSLTNPILFSTGTRLMGHGKTIN